MLREVSEKTKRVFSIFKMAIAGEQSAQAMYKEAAELCEDQPLKKILEAFIRTKNVMSKSFLILTLAFVTNMAFRSETADNCQCSHPVPV